MTTTEKCRMLLELAKKADQKDVSFSEVMKAQVVFEKSANTTTVAEICEAYLETHEGYQNACETIFGMNKRIQELEAANAELVEALEQAVDQFKADYVSSPLDGHFALISKLKEALAKARKAGG